MSVPCHQWKGGVQERGAALHGATSRCLHAVVLLRVVYCHLQVATVAVAVSGTVLLFTELHVSNDSQWAFLFLAVVLLWLDIFLLILGTALVGVKSAFTTDVDAHRRMWHRRLRCLRCNCLGLNNMEWVMEDLAALLCEARAGSQMLVSDLLAGLPHRCVR